MSPLQPAAADQLLATLLQRISHRELEAILAIEAMEEFYHLTRPLVVGSLRRILRDPCLIEEVSQDVYRHVWTKASLCDTQRYSVLAWLRTITQSRAIDSLRAGRPQRSHVQSDNWEQTLVCSRNSPEQLLTKRRMERRIAQQIEALRPEQSLLVRLAFYEGHTHAQIAAMTGTPLGTVKTRIRGALQLLRQSMKSDSIEKPAFC